MSQLTINILNAFKTQQQPYSGQITIVFTAINPMNSVQSFILETYTDSTYKYLIDRTDIGMTPSLNCNYPCQMCSATDRDYCTSCISGSLSPEYIQRSPTNNSQQTCQTQCSDGYTSNGSTGPMNCQACDANCATCSQNDVGEDISRCVTCQPKYPYFYQNKSTCFSKCIDGTYPCTSSKCCDCLSPCSTCSVGPSQCTSCLQNSLTPFLLNSTCVDTCPSGFSLVQSTCLQCQNPCITCERGSTTSCLTCAGSSQLLFGRECVSVCPAGTVTQMFNNGTQSICSGCKLGCDLCNQANNALCIKCTQGLSLLNSTCYSECPTDYVKSSDGGSTCELRPYLLEGSLIYFPFMSVGVIIIIICIASYFITRRKSLIISNAIGLLSLLEYIALICQIYQSYTSQHQYMLVSICSFTLLLVHLVFNLSFGLYYCVHLQNSDIGFIEWRKKNGGIFMIILMITLFISFKAFRLLFSRLFGFKSFSAQIDNKELFTQRIQLFGFLSIFVFTLPLSLLDILILCYLPPWGTQFYITCSETCLLSVLIALLTVLDNCCQCSRLQYYDETQALRKQGIASEYSKWERIQREEALRGLISTVRYTQIFANITATLSDDEQEAVSLDDALLLLDHLYESMEGVDERRTISFHYGDGDKMREQRTKVAIDVKSKDARNENDMLRYNNVYADSVKLKDILVKDQVDVIQQTDEFHEFTANKKQRKADERAAEEASRGVEFGHTHKKLKSNKRRGQTYKKRYLTQIDSSLSENDTFSMLTRNYNLTQANETLTKQSLTSKLINDGAALSCNTSIKRSRRKKSKRNKMKSDKSEDCKFPLQLKIDNEREYFNQRTFNIFDIMSDDSQGYLLSNKKDIINKYNFNIMFNGRSELTEEGDLPMPYRMECYNFNPHEIMGDFDYQEDNLPVILKSKKTGRLVDKNLRTVNKFGFLVDEQGNIINNEGRMRFKLDMLQQNGDFPLLLNYEGRSYDIRSIIGIFDKDPLTKKIKILTDSQQSSLRDKRNRRVNSSGYLVDDYGNIVQSKMMVVFEQKQLMFNEPPKIFKFTPFQISQIMINPMGSVNACGYLVDEFGNIIDSQNSGIVFRKEILLPFTDLNGEYHHQVDIPKVFKILRDIDTYATVIDEKLFLQGQLERLQGRFKQLPSYLAQNDSDFDDIVEETTKVQLPAVLLSQSDVSKEILMFNSPRKSPMNNASLINTRPSQANVRLGQKLINSYQQLTPISSYRPLALQQIQNLPREEQLRNHQSSTQEIRPFHILHNNYLSKTPLQNHHNLQTPTTRFLNESQDEQQPNQFFKRRQSKKRATNLRMYDVDSSMLDMIQHTNNTTPVVQTSFIRNRSSSRQDTQKLRQLQNIYLQGPMKSHKKHLQPNEGGTSEQVVGAFNHNNNDDSFTN